MKLWVSLIVVAVCALHLPSQVVARRLKEKQHYNLRMLSSRADPVDYIGKEKIIIPALFVMRKKFINDDIEEWKQKADLIVAELTPEELASDKLQAIMMTKYSNKVKFTENDQKFFDILKDLFATPEFPNILQNLLTKDYPGLEDGPDKQKQISQAIFNVIAGMSKSELKRPNVDKIMEKKLNEYFAMKSMIAIE